MPAMVTHYLFERRVAAILKKEGHPVADRELAEIGAQGPDIFFFHRVMPWQRGVSHVPEGKKLHKISPARLFEGFREVINRTEEPDRTRMIGYVQGFFCHYALDRAAHPFVLYWQDRLAKEQPDYGTTPNQYHFRIESALDTLTLRRETGRLMKDFNLTTVLPPDTDGRQIVVGRLFKPLFDHLLGTVDAQVKNISLAPADMRQALFFMTDRAMLRQKLLLRPVERLSRHGHFASSLMRPLDTGDWDYGNEAHREWHNPFDASYTSRDSFADLYDLAAAEAADMIRAFVQALPEGISMREITQDRGFSSDLPGIYEIK